MIGVIRREVYGLINGSLDEPSVWNEGGEASLIENSVGEAKEKAPPVPGEVGLRAFNPEGDGGTREVNRGGASVEFELLLRCRLVLRYQSLR